VLGRSARDGWRRVAPLLVVAALLSSCSTRAGETADPASTATASPTARSAATPDPNDPSTLGAAVRKHAKEAGVNPVLVMAILFNESYKPHDATSQQLWLALNPDASLGVANMHRAAYDDTRRGRDFAGRAFEDLAEDPGLAIEAEAWYLHDLDRTLPAGRSGGLTRDELLALGYNTGPGNMRAFARGVKPGPMAQTYLDELRDNWARSAAAVGSATTR
jgi:Transglycosylase SLT domain